MPEKVIMLNAKDVDDIRQVIRRLEESEVYINLKDSQPVLIHLSYAVDTLRGILCNEKRGDYKNRDIIAIQQARNTALQK